jgi:hypothetical protein
MPPSSKVARRALLSLLGATLLFLSLPLTYLTTNYSAGGLGEPFRQWSTSETTWHYYFGALLQPNTGIIGVCIVAAVVLFLLSLPTLSVLCLLNQPSRNLAAAGVVLSSACLFFWFLSVCIGQSMNGVSFGFIESTTSLGPGSYLVPTGLVLTTFSMVALRRQVLAELRQQHGTLP